MPAGRDQPPVSVEIPADEISVIDGYCNATGLSRTTVVRRILREWSGAKHREAILICRVAGSNPDASVTDRERTG